MAKKKSKKYILEHYECDGQLSIDDLPFTDKNVDNSVTDVDNISRIYPCEVCIISNCEYCDDYWNFINGGAINV